MKIKRIPTKGGNFLVSNESETQFGYFDPDWNFINKAFSVDWRRATNSWGKQTEEKELKESPFPKQSEDGFNSLANAFG